MSIQHPKSGTIFSILFKVDPDILAGIG